MLDRCRGPLLDRQLGHRRGNEQVPFAQTHLEREALAEAKNQKILGRTSNKRTSTKLKDVNIMPSNGSCLKWTGITHFLPFMQYCEIWMKKRSFFDIFIFNLVYVT